jgi:hypothetical protein
MGEVVEGGEGRRHRGELNWFFRRNRLSPGLVLRSFAKQCVSKAGSLGRRQRETRQTMTIRV